MIKIFFFLISIIIICTACSSSEENPSPESVATSAVQTVSFQLTQTAFQVEQISPNIDFTETPIPTSTLPANLAQESSPTSSFNAILAPTQTACDMAGFISDITIPDGANIEAGTEFVKTWELRNDGTCTWDSNYSLVFLNGELMNANTPIQFPDGVVVSPGEWIDLSVTLQAPLTEGNYTGYWILRNPAGVDFGIGPANNPFYVEIFSVAGENVDDSTLPPTTSDETVPTETQIP